MDSSGIHNKLRILGNTHQIFMRFNSLGRVIRSIGARTVALIALFVSWKTAHWSNGLFRVISVQLSINGARNCSLSTNSIYTWMTWVSLCCSLWISHGTIRRVKSVIFWCLGLLTVSTAYRFSGMSTLHRWRSLTGSTWNLSSNRVAPHPILILHRNYRRWLVWTFSTSRSATWSNWASTNSWRWISRSPVWRSVIIVVEFAALDARSTLTSIIATSGANSTARSWVIAKSVSWIISTKSISGIVLAISVSSRHRSWWTGTISAIGRNISSTSLASCRSSSCEMVLLWPR